MWASIAVAGAQLTSEQRVQDFQGLTALYARRYAPAEWKLRAFGFDLFHVQPWLARVRAAKDDLEFFEIQAEYVAELNDTHSYFFTNAGFRANLGITVDIYEGQVLIDSINRAALPAARFPFQVGDELVSLDGKPVAEWIDTISKWRHYGNPSATRRAAAGQIAVRSQNVFPRAHEIGDTGRAVIRSAGGTEDTYELRWSKTGVPLLQSGPVPMPKAAVRTAAAAVPDYLALLDQLRTWKLPGDDILLQTIPWAADPETGEPRPFVLGLGSAAPLFRTAMPAGFAQRLGRTSGDFHYSGSYEAEGFRIGYLRIPTFSPQSQGNAIRELDQEIDWLQQNTDGLVVDVMRNPGGGCYMLDAAARLIPYPFYFFGEQLKATQERLNSFQSSLEAARNRGADEWIVRTYESFVEQMKDALASGRGLTDSIASCSQFNSGWAPVRDNNPPAAIVYRKPMIVLIDAFSISAADIFPSMIQDNARAPLVGMRSSGGGGSVSSWQTGFYSESSANNTNSLVVRRNPVVTPDLPAAPYVENIGARPDVELDYMTRENLLGGGRAFVSQFTEVLLKEIRRESGR